MKKTLLVFVSLSVVVASFLGCKKKNNDDNSANIMFVNGCAGTVPGIDAKLDNVVVTGAENISFTNNSGYKVVKSGVGMTLNYFITNVGTPVGSKIVNTTNGGHYSAFAAGLITAPSVLFTDDNLSAPVASTSKVRFINLSNDAMKVTAKVENITIDTAVTSMKVSQFIQVAAGSYDLKAGDPADINTVVNTGAKTLAAGKIYTLMLTGTLSGTGVSALKLTLISNN